jgi:hypothetical protein
VITSHVLHAAVQQYCTARLVKHGKTLACDNMVDFTCVLRITLLRESGLCINTHTIAAYLRL